MNMHRKSWLTASVLLLAFASAATAEEVPHGPSIIGIDHMPTAVRNLGKATDTYRRMGFALKPGRFHENGIRNNHVKFQDGSGIELISPPDKPTDKLSAHYIAHLMQGDGPAYIMLHARNIEALTLALDSSGFKYKHDGSVVFLEDTMLDFLFFGRDNRSPTDRPEHFAHANSAVAMTGVWLALDDARRERLKRLLIALGAKESKKEVLAPGPEDAEVFAVQNGRIVVLPESGRRYDGRPVVGAEFRVRDVTKTICHQRAKENSSMDSARTRCLVPPSEAHGVWLEFHQ